MSASVEECFVRGDVKHAIMVEIDHPQGMAYLWSGLGVLEYGGNNYYGFGLLGSISEVASSTEIEIVETSFNISGVQEDFVAGLDDSVKGRIARVYEVFLDDHYRVLDRDLLVEAELDYQVQSTGADGKSAISLKAHAGLFFLRKRSAAKCSPEEARALDPDETGFDRIHLQEDVSAVWHA
jgi:hypothetical protein